MSLWPGGSVAATQVVRDCIWTKTKREREVVRGRRQAAGGSEVRQRTDDSDAGFLVQAPGLALRYTEVHCCCLDGGTGWAEAAILIGSVAAHLSTAPVQSSLERTGHACLQLPHLAHGAFLFFSSRQPRPWPRAAVCRLRACRLPTATCVVPARCRCVPVCPRAEQRGDAR